MSDICAKNLGHGHAFNRPFGSTYKCQWCGELQSDIEEKAEYKSLIRENKALKEKYEIALNRIANFEDMRDEYKQQLASLKEEQRKDSEDMLRLIADIRYVAGIAERGRGKPLGDGEKFTQAVLDYVKSLESQQRDLTQQLAAANEERDEAGVVAHDSECAMMDSNENFCTCGAHDSVSSWSPTPSAQAIETAAIIRCAEVAYGTIRANLGFSVEAEATKQSILALIPQDGRTQLEEFGMKVATETRSAVLINTREDLFTEDSSLRAIVTNLIGADLPEADKEKS